MHHSKTSRQQHAGLGLPVLLTSVCSWACLSAPPALFSPAWSAFCIYAEPVKARMVSFVVSHPTGGEPGSMEASGSHSPAILPDGNTPTCQQQIRRILQKCWFELFAYMHVHDQIFFFSLCKGNLHSLIMQKLSGVAVFRH